MEKIQILCLGSTMPNEAPPPEDPIQGHRPWYFKPIYDAYVQAIKENPTLLTLGQHRPRVIAILNADPSFTDANRRFFEEARRSYLPKTATALTVEKYARDNCGGNTPPDRFMHGALDVVLAKHRPAPCSPEILTLIEAHILKDWHTRHNLSSLLADMNVFISLQRSGSRLPYTKVREIVRWYCKANPEVFNSSPATTAPPSTLPLSSVRPQSTPSGAASKADKSELG